jgi:hypothetical protein
MILQRNKNSNHYCGPAAIALLTGRHVDDVAYVLREMSGRRAIKGVNNRWMVAALASMGRMALPVPTGAIARGGLAPTLTQALAGCLKGRRPDAAFLLIVTGHYVVIQGRKLWDNKHPDGVYLGECPYRRKRVKAVWAVEKAPAVNALHPGLLTKSY